MHNEPTFDTHVLIIRHYLTRLEMFGGHPDHEDGATTTYPSGFPGTDNIVFVLYVQEVVTLQKKIFTIFASENEVYIIYQPLQYFRLSIIRLQSKIILGHMNSIR